jgi:uncharacterized protein YecT (DUF1311 family)
MIKPFWIAVAASVVVSSGTIGVPSLAQAQASFDCRQPRSETVAIVCRDPNFSAQDRQIDRAYRTALEQATEPNRVRDNHTAWSRSLSVCGSDRDCIGRSLDEQLEALEYAAASGRRERASAAEYPQPEPVYGPAPPIERKPSEPSPEEAVDAASEFTPREPAADEVPVPVIEELRPVESNDSGGGRAIESVSPSDATAAPSSSISQMIGGSVILGLIVAVLAALLATKALADRSMSRYGWPMILNWWNVLHLVAGFALWAGAAMGSPIGGLVVAGGIWLIVLAVNVSKTDLLTGVAMSVVQPFVVAILFVIFQLSRSKPKPYNYISRS